MLPLLWQTPFFRGREGVISCHDHADYMDAISFFSSSAKISLADEGDTWYVNRWNTFNQTEREREQDPLSLITLKNLFAVYLYFLWLLLEGAFEMKMQMIANALTKLPSSIGPSIRHLVLTSFGTWHCQTIDWFWHCLFVKRTLEMNPTCIAATFMLSIVRKNFRQNELFRGFFPL